MGRHRLPGSRRQSPVGIAAGAALAAGCLAVGGAGGHATIAGPVADHAAPALVRAQAAAEKGLSWVPAGARPGRSPGWGGVAASRWRLVHPDSPQVLPAGVAPERGLQVKTILAARSISAAFPEIHQIGGVRPDALKWHPNGLALDVMIPDPGTAAGIALGDHVVAFALENAQRFGVQDVIWRGTYYTPNGPQGRGYGHYDHVHITTTGGGYPTGREVYIR
ncbi:hypothetical protein [Mycobacterium sp.]|uniref:hypothetical protein n=1 Tax=Mycobacterium sp. TaxID=1785 RepID=UPI001278F446|nr:hypothetical protein [Mycobacterium sp.]KAA8969618.1 MAG: hypothetical protein F6Q13_02330 [Mycobacterium sp.]